MSTPYDWNLEHPRFQDTERDDIGDYVLDYRLCEMWIWFKEAYDPYDPKAVEQWFLNCGEEFLSLVRWNAERSLTLKRMRKSKEGE